MSVPRSTRPDLGMTLIELLVGLVIGALVMGLVLVAYRAFSRSESRQFERARAQAQADGVIEFIRRDVQQLFLPSGDKDCTIELQNSATNLVQLSFCRWETESNGAVLATNQLARVLFKFADVGGRSELVRVTDALTGPASIQPAVTNWSGYRWPRLQVQLYDGTAWQTNWPSDEKARAMAARILLWRDDDPEPFQETMVLIPSGLSVTSRVQRSSVSPGT